MMDTKKRTRLVHAAHRGGRILRWDLYQTYLTAIEREVLVEAGLVELCPTCNVLHPAGFEESIQDAADTGDVVLEWLTALRTPHTNGAWRMTKQRKQPKKATMKGGLVTCEAPRTPSVVKAMREARKNAKERLRGRPLTERVVSSGKVAAGDMDFHHRTRERPDGVYFRVARTDVSGRPAMVAVMRWNRDEDTDVRGSRTYNMSFDAYLAATRLTNVSPVYVCKRADTSTVLWLSPRNWSRLQRRLAKPVKVTKRDDAAIIRKRRRVVEKERDAAIADERAAFARVSTATRQLAKLDAMRGQRFSSFAALKEAMR